MRFILFSFASLFIQWFSSDSMFIQFYCSHTQYYSYVTLFISEYCSHMDCSSQSNVHTNNTHSFFKKNPKKKNWNNVCMSPCYYLVRFFSSFSLEKTLLQVLPNMVENKSIVIYAFNVVDSGSKNDWILYLGVTHHMTFDSQQCLRNISPSDILYNIISDGSHTQIDGRGHVDHQYFKLKDVVHVLKETYLYS